MKNIFCYGEKAAYEKNDFVPFFGQYPESLEKIENPLQVPFTMKALIDNTMTVIEPYLDFREILKENIIDKELQDAPEINKTFIQMANHARKRFSPFPYDQKTDEKDIKFRIFRKENLDSLELLMSDLLEAINPNNIKNEMTRWLTLASQYQLYKMKGKKFLSSSPEVCDFMRKLIRRKDDKISNVYYREERRYIDKLRKFKSKYPLKQFMNFKKLTKDVIPNIDTELDIQFMCCLFSSVSERINPFIHNPQRKYAPNFSRERFWKLFSKMELKADENPDISIVMFNKYIKERILNQNYIHKLIEFYVETNRNDKIIDRAPMVLFALETFFIDFPLFDLRTKLLDLCINNAEIICRMNIVEGRVILNSYDVIYNYFMYLLLPITLGIFKYFLACHIENDKCHNKSKLPMERYVSPLIKENENALKTIYKNNNNQASDIEIDDEYCKQIYELYCTFDNISKKSDDIIRFPDLHTDKMKKHYQIFLFYNLLTSE